MSRGFCFWFATAVAVVAVAALSLASGCSKDSANTSANAMPDVERVLSLRAARLQAFRIEGDVHDDSGGDATVHFQYAQQEKNMVGVVMQQDAPQFRYLFDGKTLMATDFSARKVLRKTAPATEAGSVEMLSSLRAVFSPFTVEGFRPPLLRPGKSTAFASKDNWVVITPIDDDTLKEERVTLAKDTGDFVRKETIDKSGAVVRTVVVLSSTKDEASGFSVPKSWRVDAATEKQTTTLSSVTFAADAALFSSKTPDGFSEEVAP
jgi:outer membrane lipoprotein-sorting protein